MTAEIVMGWAVETGLVVSLLIIGILIIRRPFARAFGAGATYALWSLPIIRLVLPVIAIPQSWLPDWISAGATERRVPEAVLRSKLTLVENMRPIEGPLPNMTPEDDYFIPVDPAFDWATVIIGIWLGIAVLWFALQLLRQRAFLVNMKRTSLTADESLLLEGQAAANITGLKRLPELRVSEENIGPFVTGVINPTVVLPADFLEDYDPGQRQYALVHELAHIKRRDLWAAFAALIFRAINWFNPLVHYAAHKMRVDQEAACDAFVVVKTGRSGGNKLDYAKTLLQAAKTTGSTAAGAHLALSLVEAEQEEIEKKETSND